ncbi:expressed protein [Phakopsora pachyrhizi]|uniref:Expressed protein n=1 Tax=Phakopsora pachyrhizi TaxID=170000 RepID=A0AAV0BL58_PHAPC|nr:expressed protein [Phakopsora pachyrhizi]
MNYDGIETEGPNDDLESSIHASDFFDSDPDPSTSGGLAASAYELVESSDLSSDDSGSPLSLETEISSSEDDSDRAWSNSPSPAGNQTHHPLDVNNLFSDLHQDDLIPNTIEEQDAYIDETSHRFLDPAQGFCIDHIQDDSNHEGLPSPGSQPVSSFLDSDSSLASIASLSYSFPDPTKSCDQSIECNLSRQLSPAVTTESEGNDEERGKLGWNLEDKSSLSDDDHLTDFKDQQTNHKFRTATELDQSNLKVGHENSSSNRSLSSKSELEPLTLIGNRLYNRKNVHCQLHVYVTGAAVSARSLRDISNKLRSNFVSSESLESEYLSLDRRPTKRLTSYTLAKDSHQTASATVLSSLPSEPESSVRLNSLIRQTSWLNITLHDITSLKLEDEVTFLSSLSQLKEHLILCNMNSSVPFPPPSLSELDYRSPKKTKKFQIIPIATKKFDISNVENSFQQLEHRFSPNMEIYDRLIGTLEEPSSTRALLKPCTIKDLGRISKVCDTKLRNLTVISKRQGSPGDSRRSRDSYPLIGIVCLFVSLATWIFFKTECFQMKTNSQKIVSSSGSPGGHPKLPFPIDSSSKIGSEIQHGATLKPVNEVYPSKHESSKIKNEAKSLSLDLAESSVRKNAPGQFIKSPLLKDVSIYVQRAKKRMSSDSRSFEESQRTIQEAGLDELKLVYQRPYLSQLYRPYSCYPALSRWVSESTAMAFINLSKTSPRGETEPMMAFTSRSLVGSEAEGLGMRDDLAMRIRRGLFNIRNRPDACFKKVLGKRLVDRIAKRTNWHRRRVGEGDDEEAEGLKRGKSKSRHMKKRNSRLSNLVKRLISREKNLNLKV